MRLCFNIKLPNSDLQRVGEGEAASLGPPCDWGWVYPGRTFRDVPSEALISGDGAHWPEIRGRSYKGYRNRELSRFFPVLLCLEALTRIDEWHWGHATHGQLPPLYRSGVVYQEEPPGEEEWLDYPSLLDQGWGDCEDVDAARVAELRHIGIPAVPAIRFRDFNVSGRVVTLIHCLCLRPDGQVEDPSKVLGMRGSYDNSR